LTAKPNKVDSVKIFFKCGPDGACIVKKVIQEPEYDLNLKIHVLRNCIRCDGTTEPEFQNIL